MYLNIPDLSGVYPRVADLLDSAGSVPGPSLVLGSVRFVCAVTIVTPFALVAWAILGITGQKTTSAKYLLCEGIEHTLVALTEITLIKPLLSGNRQAYFSTSRSVEEQHRDNTHTLGNALATRILGPYPRGEVPPEAPVAPEPQENPFRERIRAEPQNVIREVLEAQGVPAGQAAREAEILLARGLFAELEGINVHPEEDFVPAVRRRILEARDALMREEQHLVQSVRQVGAAAQGGLGAEYDQIIEQVQTQLISGELSATEYAVFAKFPRLSELVEQLDLRQPFNRTLGLAFLLQESRQPRVLLFSRAEKRILQAMRLNVERIEERKGERLVEMRRLLVSEDFLLNPEIAVDVKMLVERLALEKRLVDGGGNLQEAARLLPLIHALAEREKQLQVLSKRCFISVEQILLAHDYLHNRADARAEILSSVRMRIEADIADKLEIYARDLIKDKPLNPIPERELIAIFDGWRVLANRECDRALEWHRRWEYPIVKDLIQGIQDAGETLGRGVCKALATRLMLFEQRMPACDTQQLLREVAILPQDRMRQARYEHGGFENDLRIWGIERYEILFNCRSTERLFSHIQFDFLSSRAERTQGVLGLILEGANWAHAVYLRIDHERNEIHFFDPNLGMSKNFYAGDLVVDTARMLECFTDHVNHAYPDCNRIRGYQYLLPQPGAAAGPA